MKDESNSVSILKIGLRHLAVSAYVESDDLLRRAPILEYLSDQERQHLLKIAKARQVTAGARIIEEGQAPEALFFLLEGTVMLTSADGAVEVGTLNKGDIFGLAAVIPDAVCLRAHADTDVRLALLPADQLQVLMQSAPELAELLERVVVDRKQRADAGAAFFDRW